MNLLVVHSSPLDTDSTTRTLANYLTERLIQSDQKLKPTVRDLYKDSPEHWGSLQIQASNTAENQRTQKQKESLSQSDQYCSEVLSSNQIIIAVPMWNFSIPSVLKAWIDHIVRVGVTFRYTESGPQGLLTHLKKVYVVESAGGIYQGVNARLNHAGPYLETLFRFLGAKEVVSVDAHGTAIEKEKSRALAVEQIRNLPL
jgi:FMN-dependent NADH-azoreductase